MVEGHDEREDKTPLRVLLANPGARLRAEKRARKMRSEAREALIRSVLLLTIVVVLTVAEVYMDTHGATEGARRLDVALALSLAALLDSIRVWARKASELKDEAS